MNDDHLDDHDPAPSEGRDEEMARVLAVPPLDDLTRRRLVRAAVAAVVDGAPEVPEVPVRDRRRPPWWAAAAAVAVAIAVAATTLALLSGSGSDDRPTASRAPTTPAAKAAPTTVAGNAPTPQSAAGSGSSETFGNPTLAAPGASPAPLGDLGEVGDRAILRKQVVAAGGSRFSTKRDGGPAAAGRNADTTTVTDFPCGTALAAARPGLTVVAWGTGTFHGAPAVVVTAERASGQQVAVVIVTATCTAGKPVPIPS